ncbi:MAG: CinA family protein [Desulfovibrionales bacterium]
MLTLPTLVAEIAARLEERKLMLATAESCTGGLMAHVLTNVSGSSAWFAGGVVAYSNALKEILLGVDKNVVASHGAVSEECVRAMARGVCSKLGTGVGIAVSGIAGPTGGTPEKPVGTVWIGWALEDIVWAERFQFEGNREEIKVQAVRAGLKGLVDAFRKIVSSEQE